MADVKWAAWSDSEVTALLQIWKGDKIQNDLSNMKRNKPVYEEISGRLMEMGFKRNFSQIKSKLACLISQYKTVKEQSNATGIHKPTWQFFSDIDEILGTKDENINDCSEPSIYPVELCSPDLKLDDDVTSITCASSSPTPSTSYPPEVKKRCKKRKAGENFFEKLLEFEEKRLKADNDQQFKIFKHVEEVEERRLRQAEEAEDRRLLAAKEAEERLFIRMEKTDEKRAAEERAHEIKLVQMLAEMQTKSMSMFLQHMGPNNKS